MNLYLAIILIVLIGGYCFNLLVDILNVRFAKTSLPDEFKGYYNPKQYRVSQEYLKENTRFNLFYSGCLTLIFLLFIFFGIFNLIDKSLRGIELGLIPTGLLFALVIFLIFELINLPFSAYRTFVIEQKYDFNKTTPKIFFLDKIKGLIIGLIIGALILSCLIWFFESFQVWGWVFCWVGLTLFELFLLFIWPRFIMPLFNKFEPIEEVSLREKIQSYADSENFKIKGIYKMDASRRSTKANAFFAGLGKFKRVVLFDTLISGHSPDQIVSVLAHEIGHYKKKHLLKMIFLSFAANGIMFYILSLFITSPGLFAAFRMDNISVYAGLFFFSVLYAPINMLLSLFTNWFSRKNEREADFYVVSTSNLAKDFIEALKRLSVKNLSNLTPHPLKVALSYSHPPVLERIRYIREIEQVRRQKSENRE